MLFDITTMERLTLTTTTVTCSTEFEQIARQLEFELQPRIFILLPRYYV